MSGCALATLRARTLDIGHWSLGFGHSLVIGNWSLVIPQGVMIVFDQLKRNDPHLRLLTLGVLLGMGVLATGLWWVQIISYRHFTENQKAQSFRTVRIPAIRGKILDRHGVALAEN